MPPIRRSVSSTPRTTAGVSKSSKKPSTTSSKSSTPPRKPTRAASRRPTKGKRHKGGGVGDWIRRFGRAPLGYIVILLLGIIVWTHYFAPEHALTRGWGRGDGASAKPQLASFRHDDRLSAEEVDALRRAYVDDYAEIARKEMRTYGIPASITLAQGLLESVAGTSRLATETNNHFGIKCFSKSCAPGHCRNFGDDHHKDFFRNYDQPRESFRAHSEFLARNARYAELFELSRRDYTAWAKGLSRAGYATDPGYATKLVKLIERYGLAEYDR